MPPTGPTTEAGKAASSRNAVKHGLLSEAPVVTRLENHADWQAHREAVLQDLLGGSRDVCHLPFAIGHSMQVCLAERAALLIWRLRRIACAEADSVNAGLEALEQDHKLVEARRLAEYHGAVVAVARGLDEFPDDHVLPKKTVPLYLDCALSAVGLDSSRITLPGVGKSSVWDDQQFTAAQVREAMSHVAAKRGMEVQSLHRHALNYCESEAEPALRKYAELALKRDHLARARALPDEKRLETLTRYEAHLGRELTRTLKSLRDLQSRPLVSSGQSEIGVSAPTRVQCVGNQQSAFSNESTRQEPIVNGATSNCAAESPILHHAPTPADYPTEAPTEAAARPEPENCETNSPALTAPSNGSTPPEHPVTTTTQPLARENHSGPLNIPELTMIGYPNESPDREALEREETAKRTNTVESARALDA